MYRFTRAEEVNGENNKSAQVKWSHAQPSFVHVKRDMKSQMAAGSSWRLIRARLGDENVQLIQNVSKILGEVGDKTKRITLACAHAASPLERLLKSNSLEKDPSTSGLFANATGSSDTVALGKDRL